MYNIDGETGCTLEDILVFLHLVYHLLVLRKLRHLLLMILECWLQHQLAISNSVYLVFTEVITKSSRALSHSRSRVIMDLVDYELNTNQTLRIASSIRLLIYPFRSTYLLLWVCTDCIPVCHGKINDC